MHWHQCPSRFVTVFLGTLFISIKQIKFPYMFDGEPRSALHAMQLNRASYRGEGEFSWFFSSCSRYLGYILELRWGWYFKACVCSATSGILSSYEEYCQNPLEDWQGKKDSYWGEPGDQGYLSSCHSDILIPINFQQESGFITFEALTPHASLGVKGKWSLLSRWGGDLGLSLWSPHWIQTSLHLVRWKMSLHSCYCREIRPSFE